MSEIKKHLELLHRETVISINTLQTKPFDYQKTQNMSDKKQLTTVELLYYDMISLIPKNTEICAVIYLLITKKWKSNK